jgi:alkylated DNA repair dioxygenase AlkB
MTPKERKTSPTVSITTNVPGLFCIQDFLTAEEETQLMTGIDAAVWKPNRTGTRRIQMYGPEHDGAYKIRADAQVTPLPDYCSWLIPKIKRLAAEHEPLHQFQLDASDLGKSNLTEPFVNEYLADSGLRFHQDHRTTYAEVIMGISLLCDCFMSFKLGKRIERVSVPRRSIYFMTGRSRYSWQHGLVPGDILGERRVSITLRIVSAENIVPAKQSSLAKRARDDARLLTPHPPARGEAGDSDLRASGNPFL